MSLIKQLYRALIPESIRKQRLVRKRKMHEDAIKNNILSYYKQHPSNDEEINTALSYLQSNDLSVFPYPFYLSYMKKIIEVKRETTNQLPYVMHMGHKLFFKKSWTDEHIIDAYRFLLAEQDANSPHCYLNDQYTIENNSIVIDVGAAEGIFALHLMDKIKHIYLIETDLEWIEALIETYKQWSNKITIINKFVSNIDDATNCKLDTYFANTEKIDFLKIDVDGAEQELIYGAENLIASKVKKLAICTYHKPDDNRDFSKYLLSKNYKIENSKGYMLFFYFDNFVPPYFRRGLIKSEKLAS